MAPLRAAIDLGVRPAPAAQGCPYRPTGSPARSLCSARRHRCATPPRSPSSTLATAARSADALAAADILVTTGPLDLVHPIVRRAVYDAIPTAERSLLHSTAARQLAKAGVAAESVAPHALAGEPWGDGAVVDLLRRAAARSLDRGCSTCSPGTRPASASEAARPVVEWTNVFMQPPPPHAQDLLGAAARHQQVADAFIDNFDDPAAMWHVLSDPAHTAEWLDRLGARTPVG